MPAKMGYDRGNTLSGPIRTKFKLEGQSREFEDEILGWNPRLRNDHFWDFDQEIEYIDVRVPLFDVTNDAATVLVGANSRGATVIGRAGVLVSASITAEDALTANDTNYITFDVKNTLASGSGTTAMLAATDANTTKATGGTGITAIVGRSFTIHGTAANLRVAEGDVIVITGTVTGTLANAVDLPIVTLRFKTVKQGLKPRVTRTAGSPLVEITDDVANGVLVLGLSATSEANVAAIDFGDQVTIPATRRPVFSTYLKVSGAAASTRVVAGLASAYNATFDSIVSNAWFRMEGNDLSIFIESDDGTTDTDDVDSALDFVADTYVKLSVDLTRSGYVRFWVNDSMVAEKAVTAFAVTDLLQPFIAIQKSTDTGEQSVTIDWVRVSWDRF